MNNKLRLVPPKTGDLILDRNSKVTLKLPKQLIINHVEDLYAQFNDLMESGDEVIIDISDVEKADTACLQLLCVVQKNLISVGHKISWQGRSEALTSNAKLIGVSEFLNL